jgi:hypothetical protein
MTALRWPASSEPKNSQFFLPMAVGRMAFSTRLCRLLYYAAWSVRTPVFPRKLNDPMIAAAA